MRRFVSPLTRRGQRLYLLHRNATGNELGINEFIDNKLIGQPTQEGACLNCLEYRKLIDRTFCLKCTSGTLKGSDW